jgi:hypothetical protein
MNTNDELTVKNTKLNDANFNHGNRIKKLTKRLLYIENIKTIWHIKDMIKELQHKILINEQQVRFNLMLKLNNNQ